MWTVGNVNIARSERGANCVCVMTQRLRLYNFTITSRKRHETGAHKQEAVSDWLNPHFWGPCQPSVALILI